MQLSTAVPPPSTKPANETSQEDNRNIIFTDSAADDAAAGPQTLAQVLGKLRSKNLHLLLSPSRMLTCLLTTVRAAVLTLLSLLRRALCFWRKPRSTGGFSEIDRHQFQRGGVSSPDLVSWDSWGEDQSSAPSEIVISGSSSRKPETVQDHIQAYRESLQDARRQAEQQQDQEQDQEQQQADLFADLEPQVRRQKKLYVGPRAQPAERPGAGGGRLGVQSESAMDPILAMGDELSDWENRSSGRQGWDEAVDDADVSEAIREQKRARQGASRASSAYASSHATN